MFIKKNRKEILSYVCIIVFLSTVFFLKLPFVIEIPGGLTDVSNRISIEDAYELEGSYNITYVSQLNATPILMLYSLFNDQWDLISNEELTTIESLEDMNFRYSLNLIENTNNAIMYAYNLANREVNISSSSFYITYVDELASTDLEVGDQILEINDIKIEDATILNSEVANTNVGDVLYFKVINNNVEYTRFAYKTIIGEESVIGIVLSTQYELDLNPKLDTSFLSSESGGSGGLMTTLYIYDSLIEEDLTSGLVIAGTGTIDSNGNVGAIAGVNYKIIGACNEGADVFFVPTDNYTEAKNTIEEYDLDIQLVVVNHIADALVFLK